MPGEEVVRHFDVEAMPGNEVQRYLVSLANPYFGGTENSVSVSGFLFDRQYFDWDEQRAGGRVSLGRQMNQFLSLNAGLRLESVTIDEPRLLTSPDLNSVLGNSNLFLGNVGFVYDSRFDPVESDSGSYFQWTTRWDLAITAIRVAKLTFDATN